MCLACLLAVAVLAGRMSGPTAAAEICFKPRCQPVGAVVRLGDVAEIVGADDATMRHLAAVELMPAPPPAMRRSLRAAEVADLLRLRGVTLAGYQFSGASQIVIERSAPRSPPAAAALPNQFAVRRATTRVRNAIARHLQTIAPDDAAWQVDVRLDGSQVNGLAKGRGVLQVTGGAAPWVGRQVFAIRTAAADGAEPLRVVADVGLVPAVVVAVHSLPAGARIGSNDVERKRVATAHAGGAGGADPLRTLDQVVGRETTRAITAGQVFNRTLLRQPILVRRNDVVTVYARTPGIRVRTNARAREDGSQGDLIMVESLTDRRRYFARVTGPREVDVYAGGVKSAPRSSQAETDLNR